MKNQDKIKYIVLDENFWTYSSHYTKIILLDVKNNILKINSMKDLIKIDLILEKEHRYS